VAINPVGRDIGGGRVDDDRLMCEASGRDKLDGSPAVVQEVQPVVLGNHVHEALLVNTPVGARQPDVVVVHGECRIVCIQSIVRNHG
jgi:hypothetical protein